MYSRARSSKDRNINSHNLFAPGFRCFLLIFLSFKNIILINENQSRLRQIRILHVIELILAQMFLFNTLFKRWKVKRWKVWKWNVGLKWFKSRSKFYTVLNSTVRKMPEVLFSFYFTFLFIVYILFNITREYC